MKPTREYPITDIWTEDKIFGAHFSRDKFNHPCIVIELQGIFGPVGYMEELNCDSDEFDRLTKEETIKSCTFLEYEGDNFYFTRIRVKK